MYELYHQVLAELRSVWRFRWIALLTAWLVCLAGWYMAAVEPNVYQAGARVYVDVSSSLRRLLGEQIVEQDMASQLNLVRQTMLGRVQLEEVAASTGLDEGTTTPEQRARVAEGLRSSIRIDSAGGGRNTADNLFTISYQHRDRETAILVVETLLNRLVEDTRGAARQSSESAREFLERQVNEYEQRVEAAEQRLVAFRRDNYDRLPGNEGGYFQRLQDETRALEQARQDLELARSRRDRIRQQLQGEAPVGGADLGGEDENTLAARIREQESRLEELRLRYTDRHPDVMALRERLEELRARRAEDLAAATDSGSTSSGPIAATNPVYQSLQVALNEVEVEIATFEADIRDREARLARLQSLVNEVPAVEAELARLQREYESLNTRYQALQQSLERERLSRDVQDTASAEFRILDPPIARMEPVAPDRPRMLVMGLLAGVAVGGGLAFVLGQLRPVFQTPDVLRQATGLPVLGAVSMTFRPLHTARRRLAALTFFAASMLLIFAFASVLLVEVEGPGLHNLVAQGDESS